MLGRLTALLCATAALAMPAEPAEHAEHAERGRRPTPTPSALGPPPSSFPSSLPEVPYTSTSVWLPPRPSEYPVHNGAIESTPVWIFHPGGAPLYSMCVEARGCGRGRKGRNGNVVISACDDAPGQQWAYGVQADPQIKVAGTDLCLDAGRAPRAGTKLRVSRCNGSAGQHWYIANTGLWILNDRSSDYLCADIRGGGRADGTALQLWPCAENNFNQHFYPGFCWSHTCIL